MSAQFNTGLLLLARQYRGASQSQVASDAGLNQGHYSRIENDLLPEGPSEDSVKRIAKALQFPTEFFYQSDGLMGLPLSVHPMNRKRAAVGERALRKIHAELNLRLVHMRRFLRAVELRPSSPLPRIDVDDGGGPQEIARVIRRAWLLPDGPIADLTAACERAGILIILSDLEPGIDGVAMSARDLPPCIFLNRNSSADRMRFSLAHELGHVLMHRVPTDDMEDEANSFAGELLLPERQFRSSLIGQRVTLEWLARQKRYWRVSMAFILYRASAIGALTRHQSEYLWKQLSSLGWRTREPIETDIEPESPSVFNKLVRMHVDDLGFDMDTVSKLVACNAEDLLALYGGLVAPGRAPLRIVK